MKDQGGKFLSITRWSPLVPHHQACSAVDVVVPAEFQLPYFSGTSRQGAPVRSRHRMPLMTLRLRSGGPSSPALAGFAFNRQQHLQNTPLDLRQIAAAQGCLLESAALNQFRILASIDF